MPDPGARDSHSADEAFGPRLRGRVEPPRVSALAIVAGACGAVLCCPLTSIAAIALAIVAIVRLRRSGGAVRGTRIAYAGLFLGVAGAVVQVVAFESFLTEYWRRLNVSMEGAVTTFIQSAQRGELAAASRAWAVGSPAPAADSISRFAAESETRYGRFQRVEFVSNSPGGTVTVPTLTVALLFVFERRELTGHATFQIAPGPGSIFPEARLLELSVDDGEAGALSLP